MMHLQSPQQRVESLVLSTEAIRRIDVEAIEKYGMHSLVLMENAALGCVHWLVSQFPAQDDDQRAGSQQAVPRRAVVLCGKGNNGGDGLVIARHLRARGWRCDVAQLGPIAGLSPDAQHNFKALTQGLVAAPGSTSDAGTTQLVAPGDAANLCFETLFATLGPEDLILDAMLGTGITGPPKSPLDEWIQAANSSSATRIAIDVPTGINADTGECAETAFEPHFTLTFVARKPAMAHAEHSQKFGECHVLGIGLSVQHLESLWKAAERENPHVN